MHLRLLVGASLLALGAGCRGITRAVVKRLGDESVYTPSTGPVAPTFSDSDTDRIEILLKPVADGFDQPLAVHFVPGAPGQAVVLERTGTVWRLDLGTGERSAWLHVDVILEAEQGLLGLAFHPDHAENGLFYLNYTIEDGRDYSIISEWSAKGGAPALTRELLRIEQPYQNHNGGDMAFGPDGMLYVGVGDGGSRDDPHGHGQDGGTLLGTILRLDVDGDTIVPADNPFLRDDAVRDEIYAIGLRNPWRLSFSPDGQLIVGDVGQDDWEEISMVGAGDNLGWNIREADRCFSPAKNCETDGLVDPIFTYGHDEGQSITGGYVVTGDRAPGLKGKYVFGDFVSGRMWALDVPDAPRAVPATALGRWPLLVSAFGVDPAGDLYVVDFGRGAVFVATTLDGDEAVAEASGLDYRACAACHGAAGEGSQAMKAPALAGLPSDYLLRQLDNYRQGVRADAAMQSLAAGLSEEDGAAIVEEIAAFPMPRPAVTRSGGDPAQGAAQYATCAACHGPSGEGVAALGGPPLVGQPDWYLSAQLSAFQSGARGAHPDDTFGAQMAAVSGALSEATIQDVVAYIETLRP